MLVDYNTAVDADKDRSAGIIPYSAVIKIVIGQQSVGVNCEGPRALAIKKREAITLTGVTLVAVKFVRTKK